jgi:hypothetical protein
VPQQSKTAMWFSAIGLLGVAVFAGCASKEVAPRPLPQSPLHRCYRKTSAFSRSGLEPWRAIRTLTSGPRLKAFCKCACTRKDHS